MGLYDPGLYSETEYNPEAFQPSSYMPEMARFTAKGSLGLFGKQPESEFYPETGYT